MKKMTLLLLLLASLCLMGGCGKEKINYEDYISSNRPTNTWNSIMETENGYYTTHMLHSTSLTLRYFDKSTQKCIYLCSKPECAHDGNEYCVATNRNLSVLHSYMRGEYIYLNTVQFTDEGREYALYRAKIDGTELSEVCVYKSMKGEDRRITSSDCAYGRNLIIHGNKAIVPYTNESETFVNLGAVSKTIIVDLDSKENYELPLMDYRGVDTAYGAGWFFPYEEWLYYTLTPEYSAKKYLYRHNLETEKTERIDLPSNLAGYAVIDGRIYYTVTVTEETAAGMYVYDPKSGTTEDLSAELLLGETALVNPQLGWDGTYLLIKDSGLYVEETRTSYSAPYPTRYLLMTTDGTAVAEFDLPMDIGALDGSIQLVNGMLYIQAFAQWEESVTFQDFYDLQAIFACPVEDVIAGQPEWTDLCNFSIVEVRND